MGESRGGGAQHEGEQPEELSRVRAKHVERRAADPHKFGERCRVAPADDGGKVGREHEGRALALHPKLRLEVAEEVAEVDVEEAVRREDRGVRRGRCDEVEARRRPRTGRRGKA